jgi:hypothetical protein
MKKVKDVKCPSVKPKDIRGLPDCTSIKFNFSNEYIKECKAFNKKLRKARFDITNNDNADLRVISSRLSAKQIKKLLVECLELRCASYCLDVPEERQKTAKRIEALMLLGVVKRN